MKVNAIGEPTMTTSADMPWQVADYGCLDWRKDTADKKSRADNE